MSQHNHMFRVNLSAEARDFQAIATEPGLAMLDRAGVNDTVIREWLGPYAAQPKWSGESAYFHVLDKEGAKLGQVICYPATAQDLADPLKRDLAEIDERLRKAQATNDSERRLLEILRRNFQQNAQDLESGDPDCFFFRWRRNWSEPWRLVWTWGYQRRDRKAATGLICTNPECRQLFVQRSGESAECPHCRTRVAPPPPTVQPKRRWPRVAALLLLLLLLGLGIYFWLYPPLYVTPLAWAGPAGTSFTYQVKAKPLFLFERDVTGQTTGLSSNNRILEFSGEGLTALAKSPGKANVSLLVGRREVTATVEVQKPAPPTAMRIEPADAKLAIGATLRLKAIATFPDGEERDVTATTVWKAADETIAFAYEGTLEGASAGQTTVAAHYQAYPDDPQVEASIPVQVEAAKFTSITAALSPSIIGLRPHGAQGEILVEAEDEAGERHTLTGSPLLEYFVDPLERAAVEENRYVVGKSPGSGAIRVRLNDLEQIVEFEVARPAGTGEFVVRPERASLAVNERYPLSVRADEPEEVKIVSSNPDIVRVDAGHELVGLAPGAAEVTLSYNGQERKVQVRVAQRKLTGLRISPSSITLRQGRSERIDVIGVAEDGSEILLSPDLVEWTRQPPATHVRFDRQGMRLSGLQPTPSPQALAVRHEELEAQAEVSVVRSPLESDLAGEFVPYPPIGAGDLTTGGVVERTTTPAAPATTISGERVVVDDARIGRTELFVENGGVNVGTVQEETVFEEARLPRGSRITYWNGVDLTGKSHTEIQEIIRSNPVSEESVYRVVTPDGGQRIVYGDGTTAIPNSVRPSLEIKAVDVEPLRVNKTYFQARVEAQVLREAEYRVVDNDGKPLTGWVHFPANSQAYFQTKSTKRVPEDKYQWKIERRPSRREPVDRVVNVPFILSTNP